MSSPTYITMQAAIQNHMQSGGTVNEVIEALKQSLLADAATGSWVEARELNKILTQTQHALRAKIDELY